MSKLVKLSTLVVLATGLVLGGWAMAQQAAGKADWPQYLGAGRNNISDETGWRTVWDAAPKELWKINVGAGYSVVAVVGDKVYTMGNKNNEDTVYCLKADSGQIVWRRSYPGKPAGGGYAGPRCTPTVEGGLVFTLGVEGQLACLNADTGAPVWSKDTRKEFGAKAGGWGFACSPLVMGENLVVDLGPVVCLNKKTGQQVWKSEAMKPGYSSPILFEQGGTKCLAIFNGDGLNILNAACGKPLARHPWKTEYDVNAAVPIIQGDEIFITSGYNKGCALLKFNGQSLAEVYTNKNLSSQFSTPVLWKGHIYGVSGNAESSTSLRCLDWKTGQMKWQQPVPKMGAVMLVDGKLVIQTHPGEVIIAEAQAEGFKQLAKAKSVGEKCWNQAVLCQGKLYSRNEKGDLACVDVAAPVAK